MTQAAIDIEGWRPRCTLAHTVVQTFEMTGYTLKEFLEKHSGSEFNFVKLCQDFTTHCPDFTQELDPDVRSMAFQFCSMILFTIGPESRKVKKTTGDKTWKFRFPVKVAGQDAPDVHMVHVSTFKAENSVYAPESNERSLLLTLKQAGLLAQHTLTKVIKLSYGTEKAMIMTPLCGAIFNRDRVIDLSKELGSDPDIVLAILNQSSQSGGQYLPLSDINCAVVCACAATRGLKDENVRKSIIIKTFKQYVTQEKVPDMNLIAVYSKYATGGMPKGFSYEEILSTFDRAQMVPIAKAMQSIKLQEPLEASVITPGEYSAFKSAATASGRSDK